MYYKSLFLSITGILCFNTATGADKYPPVQDTTSNIPIVPFDHYTHIKQSLEILKKAAGLMIPTPVDEKARIEEVKRLAGKFDVISNNKTIMSLTKIIPDSLQRVVAIKEGNTVVGLMDFYKRASDNQGYIETLCTSVGYTKLYYNLMQYAVDELKKMGATEIYTDTMWSDIYGQTVCQDLGFEEIKRENFSVSFLRKLKSP